MAITVTRKENGLVYGQLGGAPREHRPRRKTNRFKARSAEEIAHSINRNFYKG